MVPGEFIVIRNAIVNCEEELYAADNNTFKIQRGVVGMRMQAVENNKKMVKSQFYIVLNDSPPNDMLFSYVFGCVKDGLTVCDSISRMNVPVVKVIVAKAGLLD